MVFSIYYVKNSIHLIAVRVFETFEYNYLIILITWVTTMNTFFAVLFQNEINVFILEFQ